MTIRLFLQSALARLTGVRIIEASAWMDAWVNIQRGLQLKWELPEKAERLSSRWKLSEAKKKKKKSSETPATAICDSGILAQQPNYSHALILSFTSFSSFCCALLPPPLLFIAISFHVFSSFQAALHVPDMSRCSHTPRSFKFTPRLIFPPIHATPTATLSTTPTKTMDAPPFKLRRFIFEIKRQFQTICSDLPNSVWRVKCVIL